jgi:Mn2+/Fe2+ NRAMP family transporter
MCGPTFVISVAYVDPGNFATNMAGGARYGYLLLWVIAGANLLAMFVQTLSAKVGIATGQSLPELCRDRLPSPLVRLLWVQGELVAVATDLAEFIGGAIALNLLFGIALLPAAAITAVVSFAFLAVAPQGRHRFEAVIAAMLAIVLGGFVYQSLRAGSLAAAAFHGKDPGGLIAIHHALGATLGSSAAIAFALALLASGLASSSVGIYAGQVIMEGFLRRRMPLIIRRLITVLPAMAILAAGVDPTRALILSQVALSFGIPFALIPLIALTSSRKLMGGLVNRRRTTLLDGGVGALVISLNVSCSYEPSYPVMSGDSSSTMWRAAGKGGAIGMMRWTPVSLRIRSTPGVGASSRSRVPRAPARW